MNHEDIDELQRLHDTIMDTAGYRKGLREGSSKAISACIAAIDRKKKFYEGAHGDHWQGFFSALDTLKEEYTEVLDALEATDKEV